MGQEPKKPATRKSSTAKDAAVGREDSEWQPSAERLADKPISDTDAMGQDKRRRVIGGKYGPSVRKQATMYGAFLAILIALVVGGKLLIDELDAPPASYEDRAVWQGNSVEPPPLDFPRNGDG